MARKTGTPAKPVKKTKAEVQASMGVKRAPRDPKVVCAACGDTQRTSRTRPTLMANARVCLYGCRSKVEQRLAEIEQELVDIEEGKLPSSRLDKIFHEMMELIREQVRLRVAR